MAHKVTLQPSGHSFEVAEGQNILQAGLDAGYSLPYSCRTGICRTCRGTIREGRVDYGMVHPTYLPDSDKAKGYALLCQAQPFDGRGHRGARAGRPGRNPRTRRALPGGEDRAARRPTSRCSACACR